MFVNYVNGVVTINTYRKPNATAATIIDIMSAVDNLSTEDLTASVASADLANPIIASFINYHSSSDVDLPIEL